MKCEWDEAKNRSILQKHGFHFEEAEEMFRGILLTRPDLDEEHGEERWIGIGMTQGRVAVVAFVERRRDVIRIISLRKADHEETEWYERGLQNGLEAD
jgi:uncharacterized protein